MSNPKPDTSHLAPRWEPGQSGNPGGRPRKRPLSEAYDDLLRQVAPAEVRAVLKLGPKSTWADCIAIGQARRAVKGDSTCAKELREAIEGKATQRIELAEAEGRRPEFVVVYANAVPGVKTIDLEKVKTSEDIDKLLADADAPQLPPAERDDAEK